MSHRWIVYSVQSVVDMIVISLSVYYRHAFVLLYEDSLFRVFTCSLLTQDVYLDVNLTFFERYGRQMDVEAKVCSYWV